MCELILTEYSCNHKSPKLPEGYVPNPEWVPSDKLEIDAQRDEEVHEDTKIDKCHGITYGISCCDHQGPMETMPVSKEVTKVTWKCKAYSCQYYIFPRGMTDVANLGFHISCWSGPVFMYVLASDRTVTPHSTLQQSLTSYKLYIVQGRRASPQTIHGKLNNNTMCWISPTRYTCGHLSPIRKVGYTPRPQQRGDIERDEDTHEGTGVVHCLSYSRCRLAGCGDPQPLEKLGIKNVKQGTGPCDECKKKGKVGGGSGSWTMSLVLFLAPRTDLIIPPLHPPSKVFKLARAPATIYSRRLLAQLQLGVLSICRGLSQLICSGFRCCIVRLAFVFLGSDIVSTVDWGIVPAAVFGFEQDAHFRLSVDLLAEKTTELVFGTCRRGWIDRACCWCLPVSSPELWE
ncbi:hypothetical protein K491DRAFT_673793 [Lophiostoma macrostomum CBS 122681]|uniref:Uncharacterized protein n=1 Tax=Lophiostoma macrostomum CBS 122681 TaxID=1314788 RepID=A0A6A6TQM0_9PLEO|nr:hypothetical protein K491DRAFT_673793 [Lophiostoma macrostomum CBS 122681]